MKSLKVLSIFASLALTISAHATSLTLGDAFGRVTDGSPADADAESTYINHILQDTPVIGTEYTIVDPSPINSHDYVRYSSVAGWPLADAGSSSKSENDDIGFDPSSIDTTGWTYLIAKYGNYYSYVWYVADLVDGIADLVTTIQVPDGFKGNGDPKFKNQGLSHYTLFNKTSVPDSTSTLALLALGLGSLGLIARRRKA